MFAPQPGQPTPPALSGGAGLDRIAVAGAGHGGSKHVPSDQPDLRSSCIRTYRCEPVVRRYDFERLRGSHLYGPGPRIDRHWRSGRWAEPIDRLLGAGYSFADCSFEPDGVLFRGLPRGLQAALDAGGFGPLAGDDEVALVEQVMNVEFLSHEPGDAITVSGLHAGAPHAAILVVPAAVFRAAAQRGEAAVLAIGDAGFVFRYPLLARPLVVSEVAMLLLGAQTADAPRLPVAAPPLRRLALGQRATVEASVARVLGAHGLRPARVVAAGDWPRRV